MSYMMCKACPDHSFAVTDDRDQLRHAGIGSERDGAQATDATRRDADHPVDAVDVDSEQAQDAMFERLVAHVLTETPSARWLFLETTDQCVGYGFVIAGVEDEDGNDLVEVNDLLALADGVSGELGDLNWSERGGVVGEDANGFASVRL